MRHSAPTFFSVNPDAGKKFTPLWRIGTASQEYLPRCDVEGQSHWKIGTFSAKSDSLTRILVKIQCGGTLSLNDRPICSVEGQFHENIGQNRMFRNSVTKSLAYILYSVEGQSQENIVQDMECRKSVTK